MTDRMESGTPGDNSADPTKGPKTADGSQDCSCAEARAHLEAFLDRECTAFVQVIRTHAVKQIRIGAVFGLRLRRGQCDQNKIIVLFARCEKTERIFSIAVQARAHRPYELLLRGYEVHILCGAVSE